MKEGYIVWNESNCESEFFGVFKTEKAAERHLRKVIRTRFGRCPRDLNDVYAEEPYTEGGDSSYKITPFYQDEGD